MQYNIYAVKQLISKKGFTEALWFLSSDEYLKKDSNQFEKSNLIQLISRAGIEGALYFLGDSNFPKEMKASLSTDNYFIEDYPNVELISKLA